MRFMFLPEDSPMLWNSLGILHVFFGYRNLSLSKFYENSDSPTTGHYRPQAEICILYLIIPIPSQSHCWLLPLPGMPHAYIILAHWVLWAPQEQRHPQRNVNALLCSTQGHFLWRRYGGVGSSTSPASPLWPQNLQHQSWCQKWSWSGWLAFLGFVCGWFSMSISRGRPSQPGALRSGKSGSSKWPGKLGKCLVRNHSISLNNYPCCIGET